MSRLSRRINSPELVFTGFQVADLVRDEGGRRFKSCHSDQYLAEIQTAPATDTATETMRLSHRTRKAPFSAPVDLHVDRERADCRSRPFAV